MTVVTDNKCWAWWRCPKCGNAEQAKLSEPEPEAPKCEKCSTLDHHEPTERAALPFPNGESYRRWFRLNCEACKHAADAGALLDEITCEIERGISEAAFDGFVSWPIAKRMGAVGTDGHERLYCGYCTERESTVLDEVDAFADTWGFTRAQRNAIRDELHAIYCAGNISGASAAASRALEAFGVVIPFG